MCGPWLLDGTNRSSPVKEEFPAVARVSSILEVGRVMNPGPTESEEEEESRTSLLNLVCNGSDLAVPLL